MITAVEWLAKQIEKDSDIIFYERNLHPYEKYLEQAKEMEKEQKIEFACQVSEVSPEIGQVGINKYNTTWLIAEELIKQQEQ
jgi:predicted adenine nucleotide alpha hydrolase (AANH) superfamily ATPase